MGNKGYVIDREDGMLDYDSECTNAERNGYSISALNAEPKDAEKFIKNMKKLVELTNPIVKRFGRGFGKAFIDATLREMNEIPEDDRLHFNVKDLRKLFFEPTLGDECAELEKEPKYGLTIVSPYVDKYPKLRTLRNFHYGIMGWWWHNDEVVDLRFFNKLVDDPKTPIKILNYHGINSPEDYKRFKDVVEYVRQHKRPNIRSTVWNWSHIDNKYWIEKANLDKVSVRCPMWREYGFIKAMYESSYNPEPWLEQKQGPFYKAILKTIT